jgi:adenylate cyclase
MVGLDSGRVLVYRDEDWHVQAAVTRHEQYAVDWQASRSVLNRVKSEKRTFWKTSAELGEQLASLAGFSSVVAAPILDSSGEVIAVLYGDRKIQLGDQQDNALTELDATLMELLASGIAAGLARVEQERTALAAQARFEEFFTPRLSKRLMNDASLLEGQEREVTILFCDIRRFSRITEQFGPSVTVGWLNDVLGVLSEEILERDGVLVDYSGDEVMAMWGAPEEQPDHAQRACDAALAILKQLPALNERSSSFLHDETVDVGIGIDTGRAFVGNIGSHRKFKYGALGNTVNQASRIQGATKYFQCQLLISDATCAGLPDEMIEQQTRRVGQVKVINIEDPVSLHELVPLDTPDFAERKTLLETFHQELCDQKSASAAETLHNFLSKYPDDGPARAYRAQLSNGTASGDSGIQAGGQWVLPTK